MTDSPRRDSRSHGGNGRRNDGFNKRNDRNSSFDRNRGGKKFGDQPRGERKFSDRRSKDRFGDGERRFNDRDNRRFKDGDRRQERGGQGRRFNNENRPGGGHQRGGAKRRDAREFGAAATRGEGYRPSKGVAPELDTDVTGKELDFAAQRELRALEKDNAEAVAKHLVMAGRYLEIDPAFALEHAKYAVKRAGRISAVREAAGVTAYVAEDFEMALRELRTHRRISGSQEHLALLIDSERALGRIPKALELAEESKTYDLPAAERVEIALVVSGIKHDQGDLKGALKALEIPQLNSKRGFEYSPRLFSAYADLLEEDGRAKEAARWFRLARMTEAALGQGDFAEPEIFDIFGESELFEAEEPSVDLEAEAREEETEDAAAEPKEAETSAEPEEVHAPAESEEAEDSVESEKAEETSEEA